jgi:hypothetical protein
VSKNELSDWTDRFDDSFRVLGVIPCSLLAAMRQLRAASETRKHFIHNDQDHVAMATPEAPELSTLD